MRQMMRLRCSSKRARATFALRALATSLGQSVQLNAEIGAPAMALMSQARASEKGSPIEQAIHRSLAALLLLWRLNPLSVIILHHLGPRIAR